VFCVTYLGSARARAKLTHVALRTYLPPAPTSTVRHRCALLLPAAPRTYATSRAQCAAAAARRLRCCAARKTRFGRRRRRGVCNALCYSLWRRRRRRKRRRRRRRRRRRCRRRPPATTLYLDVRSLQTNWQSLSSAARQRCRRFFALRACTRRCAASRFTCTPRRCPFASLPSLHAIASRYYCCGSVGLRQEFL